MYKTLAGREMYSGRLDRAKQDIDAKLLDLLYT